MKSMTLATIILATLLVSVFSFIGIFTLSLSKSALERILLVLVALSAGGLIGGAFLHLIPEALEGFENRFGYEGSETMFLLVLGGFCLFLLMEQFLHWHHGHHGKHCCGEVYCREEKKSALPTLILIGDGFHNFIDGLVIAAAFMVNIEVGIATTIAVALHEIPQEIGDFGVLIYGGISRLRALAYNFFSGLTAMIGGFVGFFFASVAEEFALFILPVAAGGFIYLATSDLIPEIKHHEKLSRMLAHFIVLLVGILFMFLMLHIPFLEHAH